MQFLGVLLLIALFPISVISAQEIPTEDLPAVGDNSCHLSALELMEKLELTSQLRAHRHKRDKEY